MRPVEEGVPHPTSLPDALEGSHKKSLAPHSELGWNGNLVCQDLGRSGSLCVCLLWEGSLAAVRGGVREFTPATVEPQFLLVGR